MTHDLAVSSLDMVNGPMEVVGEWVRCLVACRRGTWITVVIHDEILHFRGRVLGLPDRIRDGAADTVTALAALTGAHPILLTGDNPRAAATLAAQAGITDVRRAAPARQGRSGTRARGAASTPLAAVVDGRDALLAVAMNGEPLPLEHGYPARLVVPGLYGYVSATKWVSELEITRFDKASAYWTERGWAAQALIKISSSIEVPAGFARLKAGDVVVAGVAWAQQRGIESVEVRVDDGPWQFATLAAEYSIDTWRQWYCEWNSTPGTRTLAVRCTDRSGQRQIVAQRPTVPDGSTGLERRVVFVE